MGRVTIGIDIGQKRDPTAIAVVEAEQRADAWHFVGRLLERLALGTSYPEVAQRVAAVAAGVAAKADGWPDLYVDATGVGTPVVDMLAAAGPCARLVPVTFTHGDRRLVQPDGSVSLGKGFLVSRLQVLLQYGRLHLPQTQEAEALARELLDYEIHVDQDANDRYGAFKVGTHDDAVTALGLATQVDPPEPFDCAASLDRVPNRIFRGERPAFSGHSYTGRREPDNW